MTSSPESDSTTSPQDRRRKRRALLAGGLVLGLGAAGTLAAWTDNVVASGIFNTGTFELQGSTDGTTFADYDAEATGAKQATLSFQLSSGTMSPGQTVYAPLTIATSSTSSLAGTFVLASVANDGGGLQSQLYYRIFATQDGTHGASCSPASTPTGTAWSSGVANATTPSVAGSALAVGKNQGSPKQALCIAVTLGDPNAADANARQTAVQNAITADSDGNHATTVTWTFTGTSTDA